MTRAPSHVVPNQVFVGLPWKNVRPRYETSMDRLEKKYPLHFTVVGRKDAQDAEDLLGVITSRIESSSYGIFDATNGNANVSLEYGYAEALDVPRVIYLSTHKASRTTSSGTIISDLGGKRRVEYKNERSLARHLDTFCRTHDYTKRFEAFLRKSSRSQGGPGKRVMRNLALKAVRFFDGKHQARRADLVQSLQALGYPSADVEDMIKKLHDEGLIRISRGRSSKAEIA